MNEEKFVKQDADELTSRIADRLGQRQQKLEQMAEWERQARPARLKSLYLTVAIAACIAVVFVFSPFKSDVSPLDELGIESPTLTGYRAATPELAMIEQMISENRFEEALQETERLLKNSDMAVEEFGQTPEIWGDDEEATYEMELLFVQNQELRWAHVYLLIRLNQNKKARKELKRYLDYPDFCEHETEARLLLKKLKK